jgi:hypothetical protein
MDIGTHADSLVSKKSDSTVTPNLSGNIQWKFYIKEHTNAKEFYLAKVLAHEDLIVFGCSNKRATQHMAMGFTCVRIKMIKGNLDPYSCALKR